jgi:hypothetical protein
VTPAPGQGILPTCATMSAMAGPQPYDVSAEEIDVWCHSHLGDHVKRVVFSEGYLSTVVGVRLSSGGSAVVKIRPWADRLDTCYAVQRHLFERGYPCPEPLVGLCPFGPWVANAEAMVVGGQPFPASGRGPFCFRRGLERPHCAHASALPTASSGSAFALDGTRHWAVRAVALAG